MGSDKTLEFKEEVPKSYIEDRNKQSDLLKRIPTKHYPEVFKKSMPLQCLQCGDLATSFQLHPCSYLHKNPPFILVLCAPVCARQYCVKSHNDFFHDFIACIPD